MKNYMITTLYVLLMAMTLNAQTIHKTYSYVGKMNTAQSVTLVHTEDSVDVEDIFFVSIERDTNGIYLNGAVITKVDNNGNFVMAIRRDSTQGMERLYTTKDRNILLLSMFVDRMMVTKYDRNLNILWSNSMPHLNVPVHIGYHYIDMEKIEYPNPDYDPHMPPYEPNGQAVIEDYIVVYPVMSEFGDSINEIATKVVRVDNGGGLVWGKVYDIFTRTSNNMRDYGCAITSFDDNGKYFPIIGGRNTQISSPELFGFLIDENGQMQTDFMVIETQGHEPFKPDVIYDPNTDSLVIVYTEEGGNLNAGHAFNVSGNSVIKIDKYFTGGRGRYFYHDCENYGNSISMLSNGDYVIGGSSSACTNTQGLYPGTSAFLRLNSNLDQVYFQRYSSISGDWNFSVHCTDLQDNSYLVARGSTLTSTFPQRVQSLDITLIKADIAGRVCGSTEYDMTEIDFETNIYDEEYFVFDHDQQEPFNVNSVFVFPDFQDCKEDGRKPAGITRVSTNDFNVNVFPTLLENNVDFINVELTAGKPTTLTSILTSIDGKEISRNETEIVEGVNKLSIEFSVNISGVYYLNIYSTDGKIHHVERIVNL